MKPTFDDVTNMIKKVSEVINYNTQSDIKLKSNFTK